MTGVKLKHVAAENEEIISAGSYTARAGQTVHLNDQITASRAGTRSYTPDDMARLVGSVRHGIGQGRPTSPTTLEVTGESSTQAARRLFEENAGPTALLNFASARNPGGGYLRGARAQEEDLCRVSALYTTLLEAPDYYAAHRASSDLLYSNRVIYSPDVPVFRNEHYALLDRPYPVSFLTCAAPNAGEFARHHPEQAATAPEAMADLLANVLVERAAGVLAVAAHHGQRVLILGAWGCGVFRNDPAQVAAAFGTHLSAGGLFENAFTRIVFAVLDNSPTRQKYTAFHNAFAPDPGTLPPHDRSKWSIHT